MSHHIATRLTRELQTQPVFLADDFSATDLQAVLSALTSNQKVDHGGLIDELCAAYGGDGLSEKPFAFVAGAAVIPVHGMLINRFSGSYGFLTGYEFIQRMTAAADADPDVRLIVYDIHSYGGLVHGAQETWDAVVGAGTPTLAVIDSMAYSAAYYVASAADRIAITPSGGAGSIGAYKMRVDVTEMLAKGGVKVDFISAGAYKLDGQPATEMSDDERKRHQAAVDVSYDEFVSAVAVGRKMDEEAVRKTEAGTFSAQDALRLGLVDDIMTATAALSAAFSRMAPSGIAMTTPNTDQAAIDAQVAEARTTAISAERARIAGILGCAEAEGRSVLAQHLATQTDMTVQAAQGILAVSAKVAPATDADGTGNPLEEAMARQGTPGVGDDPQANGQPEHMTLAARIIAAQGMATGVKHN